MNEVAGLSGWRRYSDKSRLEFKFRLSSR